MFIYYKEATECYAYLEDVAILEGQALDKMLAEFAVSIWFKRGWTLQELVAPDRVLFCNVSWEIFGHKTSERASIQLRTGPMGCAKPHYSKDLVSAINSITGTPVSVLRLPDRYRDYGLSQRISWTSDRKTGRIENEAHCLLGLLDVHMPLLYGERRHAFLRLQKELLENSTDESILAWNMVALSLHSHEGCGAALHPTCQEGKLDMGLDDVVFEALQTRFYAVSRWCRRFMHAEGELFETPQQIL